MPAAVIASTRVVCTVCQTQGKEFCGQALSSASQQPCEEDSGIPLTLALPWHTVRAPTDICKMSK